MVQIRPCESHSLNSDSKQFCEASFSSSFEIYAAIGGDPDINQVDALFITASKAVLNINNENDRTRARTTRRSTRRTSSETKTQLTTEVDIIDCDKLDIYFSSEDDIQCFSVVINILVTSSTGDLDRVSTTAENLAFAAELAFTNGEFEETLKNIEGPILVHLVEMAPGLSSYSDEEDDDDSSSIDSDEFDDFLDTSYREYLEDQSRLDILSRLKPPTSPSTVSNFPTEYLTTNPLVETTKQKVKFNSVVRVKNTLSRHDMTPTEAADYWSGEDEFMTIEQRDRIRKMLMDKWTHQKEQESRQQTEEDLDKLTLSLRIPILPSIKQLLPATEREGDDGYTYTISIRD